MRRSLILAALCAAVLSGCTSRPDRAEIFINTAPPGASCTLSRLGQPIATAEPTPAIALVEPGDDEVAILCRRQGYADGSATLTARKAAHDLWFGRASDNQQRVDIALAPRRP